MEPNSDPPPFWSPTPPISRRRSSSPPFISLPILIILLPTLALILLFFAIRPLLSLTNQVFRPSLVKKSWDSFNVFLVLFAIICGIFARRNDDVPTAADRDSHRSDRRTVDTARVKLNGDSELSQQWFGFAERRFSDPAGRTPVTTRLRRNSSYPDLRQESPWENGNDGSQFRFFDDFEINKFRSRSFEYRTRGNEREESPAEIKVIPVDSFVANSSPAPQRMKSPNPPPPPPPPLPLPVTQRKSRRTYQTIQKKEEVREVSTENNPEFAKSQSPPPPPPLPPRTVIPPSPVRVRLEEKFGKSVRKKTNVKKEIAMALASLYRKRKKKQKAKDVYDGDRRSPTEQRPPPPPPPPPPSVFRIFKKSSKNKRVHSESAPPPPPPPPPVSSTSRSTKKKIQIPLPPSPPPPPSSQQRNSTANRRPPLPTSVRNSYVQNQSINNQAQSPTATIPPPPPPPPFKTTTDVKSAVQSDTVESRNSETSRCGSPDPENVNPSSIKETPEPASEGNGGAGVGPVCCPSPDVNIKAANFIARLRDEWRLEKMNSVREKERLGQGPNYEMTTGLGPN